MHAAGDTQFSGGARTKDAMQQCPAKKCERKKVGKLGGAKMRERRTAKNGCP